MDVDLNGCIKGRKQAWDAFVQQTARLIYAAVQRSLRAWPHNQQDVDDRVQDVYVKLLADDCRLLKTFDPKRASLSTWLTLVTRSTVRDYMMKRRVETVTLGERDAMPPHIATRDSIELPLPLDLLTDRQRLVLQMLFDEEMSVEQAAARIGVDQQTIRSTKHKALTRLREHFKLNGHAAGLTHAPQKPQDQPESADFHRDNT